MAISLPKIRHRPPGLDWAVFSQHCLQLSTHISNTLAGIKTALAELKALHDWNPKQAEFCMEHTTLTILAREEPKNTTAQIEVFTDKFHTLIQFMTKELVL